MTPPQWHRTVVRIVGSWSNSQTILVAHLRYALHRHTRFVTTSTYLLSVKSKRQDVRRWWLHARFRTRGVSQSITGRRAKTNLFSYDFEYEDEDEEQGGDVDIENKYYNAKQMKADNPEEAIDEFLGLPALEPEKGDWWSLIMKFYIIAAKLTLNYRGFKGLKQAIKLEFKIGRYDKVC